MVQTGATTIPTLLIVIAIIGFLSQPVATALNVWLQSRARKLAAEREERVRLAAEQVKKDAAESQRVNKLAQTQAAAALLEAARTLAASQTPIVALLTDIQTTGKGTHALANSQRTGNLRTIADLRKVIALLNPHDAQSQTAWTAAEKEAKEAEDAQATGVGAVPE